MSVRTAPSSKVPYKRTPIFDETTLPAELRREHRTKAGVWGLIRVLEGRRRVEPLGPMRMQVEFYNRLPDLER